MKVVVLYNTRPEVIQEQIEAEYDSEFTIQSIQKALSVKHEVVLIGVDKDFKWIKKILDLNADIVLNVCEGYRGPARESVFAAILEQLSIPYAGPDSTNLLICQNKTLSKLLLNDVCDFPHGYLISDLPIASDYWKGNYPMIVKLNSEGSSIGLSEASIVYTREELLSQVDFLLRTYNQSVIAEEFIEGKDYSIAYIEGLGILGPCIVENDATFYDYNSKTIYDSEVTISPIHGDFSELKKIAQKIVTKLDLRGYGKLDFRYRNGVYYLIEVNGQVSLHPKGEFIVCAERDGFSFEQIVNHIVSYAYRKKQDIIFSAGVGDCYV